MLFNSWEFAIFYVIVLALFWLLRQQQHARNLVLLAGSMFFYGNLHISFPFYLMALTGISFLFAQKIEKTENEKKRKRWLRLAICVLAAGLVYTKYSSFLLGGIKGLSHFEASVLHILVPVGISFYTFATIGYVLDVYYERIEAEQKLLTYATYISFFPQLLSGPIPSASSILPQFKRKPVLHVSVIDEAVGEFLWGLFKKLVVADNISMAVSFCFSENNSDLGGSSLFIGAALFGISIYADFSGYSSMARGCARLFGIDIVQNFRTPLFSKSISEYWRRWHISLTTWLNTYIYNPIVFGLKHWRQWGVIAGVFITFFISGIWHGAGWQYIIFGVVNGLAIIFEILTRNFRARIHGKMPQWLSSTLSSLAVLVFILFSWIFFRAASAEAAFALIRRICSASLFSAPDSFVLRYIKWCIPLIVVEYIQRNGTYLMDMQQWLPARVKRKDKVKGAGIMKKNILIKAILYTILCSCIYLFHKKMDAAEFYYFKF